MNDAVDMGDVSQNSDESQLSPNQIAQVMQSKLNVISPCVGPELARSGRIGSVQVDMAIANSGQVVGVTARQGSGEFRSCVESAVRRIRFPSFGAPRMGARYTFHVE